MIKSPRTIIDIDILWLKFILWFWLFLTYCPALTIIKMQPVWWVDMSDADRGVTDLFAGCRDLWPPTPALSHQAALLRLLLAPSKSLRDPGSGGERTDGGAAENPGVTSACQKRSWIRRLKIVSVSLKPPLLCVCVYRCVCWCHGLLCCRRLTGCSASVSP